MDARTLITIGLVCDIIGAWLIAWGVIASLRVKAYPNKEIGELAGNQQQRSRPEIREILKGVRFKGIAGAILLTIGFACQLIANYLPS